MIQTMFFVFLFFLIFFSIILLKERRNLYSGIIFMLLGITLAALLLVIIFRYSEIIQSHVWSYLLIQTLAIGAIAVVVFFPIIVLLAFLYSAILIIYREGFTFRNLLSLGAGVGLVFFMYIFPRLNGRTYSNIWFSGVYVYIGLIMLYFIFVASVYTISSFINMVNIFPRKLDYVVVLGAGLIGDKVTPLLASRINKGIKIYKKNPGSKLIMSGGQGVDELIPEAEAMYNYALGQGIEANDIIIENNSTTTEENIRFSYSLMKQGAKFALVTNYYHIFRALVLARVMNIKCIGYGAPTKFYFTLNAFIREFIGYLYLKRKRHVLILTLCTILYLLAIVAMEWYARNFY